MHLPIMPLAEPMEADGKLFQSCWIHLEQPSGKKKVEMVWEEEEEEAGGASGTCCAVFRHVARAVRLPLVTEEQH